jgi:hypothetical protein
VAITPPQGDPSDGPHLIEDDSDAADLHNQPPQRPQLFSPRRSPRFTNPHIVPPDAHANSATNQRTTPTPKQATAQAVTHDTTGLSLSYRLLSTGTDSEVWLRSMTNDLGRLAQGVGKNRPLSQRIQGTNTIFFVHKHDVPHGRKVTYMKQEATLRPNKSEVHRVRNCAGGDRLDFPGPTATQCASLVTTKILINSTISTPNARFSAFDIKNFYYGTPMARYEYIKIHISKIPDEFVQEYNLHSLATSDGWVYMEVRKGMPGLKQAGRIANDRLTIHLAKYGYRPAPRTPSLWLHDTRPISFALIVDDFGVKYVGKEHALHLLDALKQQYTVTEDWGGALYSGITIGWNYAEKHVDVSMPSYLPAVMHKYQHPTPKRHQGAPHAWTTPTYGAKIQYATADDDSPILPAPAITKIQQKVGSILYYAVGVDPIMLPALGSISSSQSKATKFTQAECDWLMDFAASNPLAIIRYHASGMVLYTHADGSYLSERKARSRAAGHFFLSDKPVDPTKPPLGIPPLNGPVHTMCKIIDVVVGSAAEAEIGSAYLTAQDAVPMVTTLEELGHQQPPTPMQVDNTTSEGFANGTIKQKRSKAMDMRWHWLQCRVRQGKFLVYYRPGKDNMADPFTKHHPPSHIESVTPKFLRRTQQVANASISTLVRGCVSLGARMPVVRTSPPRPHVVTRLSSPTNNTLVLAPNSGTGK